MGTVSVELARTWLYTVFATLLFNNCPCAFFYQMVKAFKIVQILSENTTTKKSIT